VESKKKLIRKMAAMAAFVLLVGLTVVVFTSIIASGARAERREEWRLQRAQAMERGRSDLEELAGQITAIPVDANIVGEVQARYYEQVPQGRRFVWGMDADGEFLFGVPREGFARLNSVWDAHGDSIVGEGAFVDRQDFLRQLIQESEELRLADLAPDPDDPDDTPWSRLRRYGDRDDWMVFSAPLVADDGSALGNLYLKMEDVAGRWEPWRDSNAEGLLAVSSGVSGLAGTFLWFLLPTWVYVDARERGVRRALLWSFLVLISVFVGLVVYLIARPEQTTLNCPSCEREVNGGAYCPHCGHDLSSAFCAACRYPLKPDWAFCPSCRTEVARVGSDTSGDAAKAGPESADAAAPENG
jgi:hypothetical protein